jgi:heat shock protein HslJ
MMLGPGKRCCLWALLSIIVAACTPPVIGSVAGDSAPSVPELIGTEWHLGAYANGRGSLEPVLPGSQATAKFGSNGFVTGSGGCNTYSAVFQTDAILLSLIGPITTTHQTCEQPVMDQEDAYLAALARSATYRFEEDQLVLVQSGGTRLAEYSH